MQKSKKIMASTLLIWLCWLVYACSYIGKLNYNASINQVMSFYNVDKDQAGLVGTFFFFAYGAGQVINGIFCKKYNLKYTRSNNMCENLCNLWMAYLWFKNQPRFILWCYKNNSIYLACQIQPYIKQKDKHKTEKILQCV